MPDRERPPADDPWTCTDAFLGTYRAGDVKTCAVPPRSVRIGREVNEEPPPFRGKDQLLLAAATGQPLTGDKLPNRKLSSNASTSCSRAPRRMLSRGLLFFDQRWLKWTRTVEQAIEAI